MLGNGLPWWLRWSSVCLQCRRPRFNPWVRKIAWRRKWQPTPVFLLGKSHERGSLVGYSPWGHKESDMTERLQFLLGNELGLMYVIEMCVQMKATNQGTHLRWTDSPGARGPFLPGGVARFSKNQTNPQKHPVPWLHLNFG